MTPEMKHLIGNVAQTVNQLIAECRKGGPLYVQSPRSVAQVSRTAKWLRNAIERLQRELAAHDDKPPS
jgi:hypothetical protein